MADAPPRHVAVSEVVDITEAELEAGIEGEAEAEPFSSETAPPLSIILNHYATVAQRAEIEFGVAQTQIIEKLVAHLNKINKIGWEKGDGEEMRK